MWKRLTDAKFLTWFLVAGGLFLRVWHYLANHTIWYDESVLLVNVMEKDFAGLLLQPGVGARTVEALAAVAEIVHGAPCRFADPARFSLAHGGKDGHPFPVPLRVYDRTISVLKHAVEQAKLGRDERLAALRRLDEQARRIEQSATGPDLDTYLEEEREKSPSYGGRDVSGPARTPARREQLALPLAAPEPLGARRAGSV